MGPSLRTVRRRVILIFLAFEKVLHGIVSAMIHAESQFIVIKKSALSQGNQEIHADAQS